MSDSVKVKESAKFDPLIGKKVKKTSSASLADIIEFDDEEKKVAILDDESEWKKYWKGMPDFEQEDNPTYKTIYVHFRCEEDYEEFSKLIQQKLTLKTKSIWHPKLDRTKNSLLRWIEEDDD